MQYFLNGFTEHLKPQLMASMYFKTISVMETIGKGIVFIFRGLGGGLRALSHWH